MIDINIGSGENTGDGDKLRDAMIIVNDNFTELQTLIGGHTHSISQIDGLQTELDALNNDISALNADITDLQNEDTAIYGEISSVNGDITSINNNIITINETITNLINQVNDLEGLSEAPIDGFQYARQDAEWTIVEAVGATPSLFEVTQIGNTTSSILFGSYSGNYINISPNNIEVNNKIFNFPGGTGGTFSLSSDLASATASFTSSLALKENLSNKVQTLVGATSTTYPSTFAITSAGYGDMTTTTGQTVSGVKTFLNTTLGLRNIANTFTSFFTNTNVASRTYTLQDRNGTLADLTDIAGRMAVPSGTINTIPKFLTATTIGNSRIFDTGTFLGVGTVNKPLKDISLGNSGQKNIGIEDSDSLSVGKNLVVSAGRTINFLINSVFTAVDSNFYSGSGAASAPNGDIYFQGFSTGLFKLTLGTNTITFVPGQGNYYGGISIGYDNSIYQTPFNGGTLVRDMVVVAGASGHTTLGILSSKLSNKLYASFNGNIQYSTNNGVTFSVIQAGSIGIGKMCEDSFGSVYALISGFLWKQNLGTGLFVNTTIPLAGTYIAIDTNNNIYSVDQNSLYKLSFGSSVYSLFKDISGLGKGNGLTGIAIDTNNRIFLSCGLNGTSQQWQLLTDAAGTPDLDGGTLKLKSGTGKGTGQSRIQLVTGGKTASGTNMQTEKVRIEIDENGTTNFYNNDGVITNYINAGGTHSFSNDIVLTKYFTTGSIIYSDGNWHSFNYPTSFFQANFDNTISYGSGASPVGTPSVVIPNLNHIPGKKLNKFTWNTDYCDSADAYISIVKYDVVSGNLVNGREILNQQIRILTSGTNTQGAFPYSKNSIHFTTSDIVDTPGGAQCSIYFVFLKIDSSSGGGLGTSNIYFNFN